VSPQRLSRRQQPRPPWAANGVATAAPAAPPAAQEQQEHATSLGRGSSSSGRTWRRPPHRNQQQQPRGGCVLAWGSWVALLSPSFQTKQQRCSLWPKFDSSAAGQSNPLCPSPSHATTPAVAQGGGDRGGSYAAVVSPQQHTLGFSLLPVCAAVSPLQVPQACLACGPFCHPLPPPSPTLLHPPSANPSKHLCPSSSNPPSQQPPPLDLLRSAAGAGCSPAADCHRAGGYSGALIAASLVGCRGSWTACTTHHYPITNQTQSQPEPWTLKPQPDAHSTQPDPPPIQPPHHQASMLAAYLLGQLPAGFLADRLGGLRILLIGLTLWSLATALTAVATALPITTNVLASLNPGVGGGVGGGAAAAVAVLYASRVVLGLASACAMPCVTATAVEWVPAVSRSGAVSLIYALFNIGAGSWVFGYWCWGLGLGFGWELSW